MASIFGQGSQEAAGEGQAEGQATPGGLQEEPQQAQEASAEGQLPNGEHFNIYLSEASAQATAGASADGAPGEAQGNGEHFNIYLGDAAGISANGASEEAAADEEEEEEGDQGQAGQAQGGEAAGGDEGAADARDSETQAGGEEGLPVAADAAFVLVATSGNVEAVRARLPEVDVNEKDANGYTALMAAASYARVPVLECLLGTEGVQVNAVDDEGDSALHYCTSVECAKLLVAAGADTGLRNAEDLTPLQAMEKEIEEDAEEDNMEEEEKANLEAVIAFLRAHEDSG